MLKLFKPVNNCFIVDRLPPRSEHDLVCCEHDMVCCLFHYWSAVYFITLFTSYWSAVYFITIVYIYIYLFARSIKLLNQIMADTWYGFDQLACRKIELWKVSGILNILPQIVFFNLITLPLHKLQILAGSPQQHNANYCGPKYNIHWPSADGSSDSLPLVPKSS